ncbi:MAG: hypothetical protein R3C52_01485 [Hyphomonadaceae bacterium]
MAQHETGRGSGTSNAFLYFIVGALAVAVVVLGYVAYLNVDQESPAEDTIERSADAIGDAADDIADAVSDASDEITPVQPTR